MTKAGSALFGIASFLPGVGVLAAAFGMVAHPEVMAAAERLDLHALGRIPASTWLVTAALFGGIVAAQMVLAVVAGVTFARRPQMTPADKIVWPLACLFVGSVAAPITYFKFMRGSVP